MSKVDSPSLGVVCIWKTLFYCHSKSLVLILVKEDNPKVLVKIGFLEKDIVIDFIGRGEESTSGKEIQLPRHCGTESL